MVWKPVSPQNSYAEILMPDAMLLECGVLGRHLGHEGRAVGNGSGAPIKGAPQRPSASSTTLHSLNWPKKFPWGNANAGKGWGADTGNFNHARGAEPGAALLEHLCPVRHIRSSAFSLLKVTGTRMLTEVWSAVTERRQSGCLSSSR